MRKVILIAAVSSAVLAACGGGGDSGAAVGAAGVPAGPNAFDAVLGTYKSGCVSRNNVQSGSSQDTTLVVSAPEGTDKAKVVVTDKFYPVPNCAGSPDESIALAGQITASAVTKNITTGVKLGVAKSAVFKYESLTVFNGMFTMPALGATTKVGYLIDGQDLYGLSGSGRDANGLSDSFSRVKLVKQ